MKALSSVKCFPLKTSFHWARKMNIWWCNNGNMWLMWQNNPSEFHNDLPNVRMLVWGLELSCWRNNFLSALTPVSRFMSFPFFSSLIVNVINTSYHKIYNEKFSLISKQDLVLAVSRSFIPLFHLPQSCGQHIGMWGHSIRHYLIVLNVSYRDIQKSWPFTIHFWSQYILVIVSLYPELLFLVRH